MRAGDRAALDLEDHGAFLSVTSCAQRDVSHQRSMYVSMKQGSMKQGVLDKWHLGTQTHCKSTTPSHTLLLCAVTLHLAPRKQCIWLSTFPRGSNVKNVGVGLLLSLNNICIRMRALVQKHTSCYCLSDIYGPTCNQRSKQTIYKLYA